MISKIFTPKRTTCKVTFNVPGEWAQNEAVVVGDFNNWDPKANRLERKNGIWQTTVRFRPNSEIRFRYFLDGRHWANDEKADAYVANGFGSEDSLIKIGS